MLWRRLSRVFPPSLKVEGLATILSSGSFSSKQVRFCFKLFFQYSLFELGFLVRLRKMVFASLPWYASNGVCLVVALIENRNAPNCSFGPDITQ